MFESVIAAAVVVVFEKQKKICSSSEALFFTGNKMPFRMSAQGKAVYLLCTGGCGPS